MTHRWGRKVMLGAALLVLGYSMWIGLKNIFRYNAYVTEYNQLRRDMMNENRMNDRSKRWLSLLQSPSFWEMAAKTKLGYVKEGEVVYKVHPGPVAPIKGTP